jgi:hypothetical protein
MVLRILAMPHDPKPGDTKPMSPPFFSRRAGTLVALGWLLLLPVVISAGLAEKPAIEGEVQRVRLVIAAAPFGCLVIGLKFGQKIARVLAALGLVVLAVLVAGLS